MRYHWGLAIGHTYTHGQTESGVRPSEDSLDSAGRDTELEAILTPPENVEPGENDQDFNEEDSDVERAELALTGHGDWEDVDSWRNFHNEEEQEESSDEMVLAMDDMYGHYDVL
jgi:hypothetical protein